MNFNEMISIDTDSIVDIKIKYLPLWVYPMIVNMNDIDRDNMLFIIDKVKAISFNISNFDFLSDDIIMLKDIDNNVLEIMELIIHNICDPRSGWCVRGGIVGSCGSAFLPTSINDSVVIFAVCVNDTNGYFEYPIKLSIREICKSTIGPEGNTIKFKKII